MFSAASGRCHAISAPALVFLVPALGPVKLPTLHYVRPFVSVSVCNNDDRGRCNAQLFQTLCIYVVCTVPFRLCNGPQRCYIEGLDQGRCHHCYASSPLFLSHSTILSPASSHYFYYIVVSIIALLHASIVPLNTDLYRISLSFILILLVLL